MSVKYTLGLVLPNLPYLIHGDVRITESQAMLRYIANTFGPADISGKDNVDKATVDMFQSAIADIKLAISTIGYLSGDQAAVEQLGYKSMEPFSKYLEERKFLAGDYVTFVDFFLFEQLEHFNVASDGGIFRRYPSLDSFHKNIISLPNFGVYYKSDRFVIRPFNNKSAKLFTD